MRGTIALVASIFLAYPVAAQIVPESTDNKANAADLVASADRAIGFVVKSARDSQDPALSPDANDAKPFWQALGKLNDALDKTERGLTLQDPSFHRALADATSYIVAAQVTYRGAGATDPAVADGLQKIENSLRLLNENYSLLAVQAGADGELTAAQQQSLAKLQAQQAEIDKKLAVVEEKVKGNAKALEGVEEVKKYSKDVRKKRRRGSGFASGFFAGSVFSGLMWGWHWYWGPWGAWCPIIIIDYTDIYTDAIVDLDYNWDLIDTELDIAAEDLDVDISESDLGFADEFLEQGDFGIDDGALAELSGFDLSAADLADAEGFSDAGLADFDFAEPDIGMAEPVIEPEPMPMPEPEPMPMPMPEPEPMMDYGMDSYDVGGFDDFGGGFDF